MLFQSVRVSMCPYAGAHNIVPYMDAVKAVKSNGEVELLRRACHIAGHAFREVQAVILHLNMSCSVCYCTVCVRGNGRRGGGEGRGGEWKERGGEGDGRGGGGEWKERRGEEGRGGRRLCWR